MLASPVAQGTASNWCTCTRNLLACSPHPSWTRGVCVLATLFCAVAVQLWSLLYACIGAAAFVVWTEGGFSAQQGPLTLLGINMVLNLAWMPVRP